MIFEKAQKKPGRNVIDYIGLSVMSFSLGSVLTFSLCYIHSLIGFNYSDFKSFVIDSLTAVAQIATALTFLIVLNQHIKGKVQQRQSEIYNEAKSQVEKMINVIKTIDTKNNTSIENIRHSMVVLCNLSVNFEELYREMEEGVQLAMLRMQWQDMYYNYLLQRLRDLDIDPILRNRGIGNIELNRAKARAKTKVSSKKVIELFEKYAHYDEILKELSSRVNINMREELSQIDHFNHIFFNKDSNNDKMFGLMNISDIRIHAPLLALADPKPLPI